MSLFVPEWLVEATVYALWLVTFTFAAVYSLKAPWWTTPMGWNLFTFDFALMLTATPSALTYLFRIDTGTDAWQVYAVADITFVALIVLHRLYLLLRAQGGWNFWGRKEEAHDNDG